MISGSSVRISCHNAIKQTMKMTNIYEKRESSHLLFVQNRRLGFNLYRNWNLSERSNNALGR